MRAAQSQPILRLEFVPALVQGGKDQAGNEPDFGAGVLGKLE